MKGLTDIPGILVGHASDYDGLTGCTVMLCEAGAVAGGDIRGSATGTEEWDVLNPMHVTDRIHGVVFAGGSAFGLEAASGVRRFLEHKGVGFKTGAGVCRLWSARFCYDLGIGKTRRPAHARNGRSGGRGGHRQSGGGRRGGRGHRRDGRQDAGHEAGDEVGRRIVDGDARGPERRRDGFGAGGGERGRRCARSGDGKDCRGRAHDAPDQHGIRRQRAADEEHAAPTGFTRENTTLVVVATNARSEQSGGDQAGAVRASWAWRGRSIR